MDTYDREKYPNTGFIYELSKTPAISRWLIEFFFSAQEKLADGLMDETQVVHEFKQAYIRPGLRSFTGKPIAPESIDFDWLYEQCKSLGDPSAWQKARLRSKIKARGQDPDQVNFPWDLGLEDDEVNDIPQSRSSNTGNLPDAKPGTSESTVISALGERSQPGICPYCAETIQAEAALCRYCGRLLKPEKLPEPYRRCPACGEWVLAAAKRCRYCFAALPSYDPAQAAGEPAVDGNAGLDVGAEEPQKPAKPEFEEPIRVLVVDDMPDTRDAIRSILEKAGDIVVVGEAATGVEGLERYAELRPQVVCTNVCMPVMDGIAMTKEMLACFPEAQIFILSVQAGNMPAMREAMLAGARDFIQKPPAAQDLIDVVHRLGRDYRKKQVGHGDDE